MMKSRIIVLCAFVALIYFRDSFAEIPSEKKRESPENYPVMGSVPREDPREYPNQIIDLKVVKETTDSLEVEVNYVYTPQGEDWARLGSQLYRNGQAIGFSGHVPAVITPGRNKAVIKINMYDQSPDHFMSDVIEVSMYRKKGYDFLPNLAQKQFAYEKFWKRGPSEEGDPKMNAGTSSDQEKFITKPAGPGQGRIDAVRVARETNDALELAVDYFYDPQGSPWAELSGATFFKGPDQHSFDRQIPIRLKEGSNTAILRIERSLVSPQQYASDAVRVVMYTRVQIDPPSGGMLADELFLYKKAWSEVAVADGAVEASDSLASAAASKEQPLPRVAKEHYSDYGIYINWSSDKNKPIDYRPTPK